MTEYVDVKELHLGDQIVIQGYVEEGKSPVLTVLGLDLTRFTPAQAFLQVDGSVEGIINIALEFDHPIELVHRPGGNPATDNSDFSDNP